MLNRDELLAAARLLAGLPSYFNNRLTTDQAWSIVEARLATRDSDFLALARRTIFQHRDSPYQALLRHAGCEPGDLERLVLQEGLEGALADLYRRGVYLTVDEMRGRRPVRRGSLALTTGTHQVRNPLATFQTLGTSGGSRGARNTIAYSLACFRDRGVNTLLTLAVQGGEGWVKAVWGVPGGSIGNYLRFSPFGRPPARWFLQVDDRTAGLHPRYPWSATVFRWGARLGGARVPRPELVPIADPLPIARWLVAVLRSGQTPHLELFVSSAVRLCRAAVEAGLELDGARLLIIGEPTTAARLAAIERSGARAVPDYGSSEAGGPVGHGCLRPAAPDDIHIFKDLHALIQAGQGGPLPPRALLVSTLRASSPLILFNISMGDQAELVERSCGCPLARPGWSTHLQQVRSFEKLTAAGMTFIDSDVIRVLEELLPERFGGGPTDYQLQEIEAADGQPRLDLLVHPRLGPLEPGEIAEAFLQAIGPGSGTERLMSQAWREAEVVRIVRRAPALTSGGKIQHLHAQHGGAAERPSTAAR